MVFVGGKKIIYSFARTCL